MYLVNVVGLLVSLLSALVVRWHCCRHPSRKRRSWMPRRDVFYPVHHNCSIITYSVSVISGSPYFRAKIRDDPDGGFACVLLEAEMPF